MVSILLLLLAVGRAPMPVSATFMDPMAHRIDARHDPSYRPTGPLATATDGPEVGQTINFWALDYSGESAYPTFYLTPATCRFVGEKTYIFVEDAVWGTYYNQEAVDELSAALEDSTPSGEGGVVDTEVPVFGEVPDEIDGDPRVYFLVLDIRDDYHPQENPVYYAGFFSPYNQFTDEEAFLYYGGHSNEVEMLYLDCNPSDMSDASYTASHELVHLIQWGVEPFSGEELWVIENQAQSGTYVCGYPAYQVQTFLEEGGVTPINWTSFPPDQARYVAGYGAGFLFFAYLYENYGGEDFLYCSLRSSSEGVSGVCEAIKDCTGESVDITSILVDWMLANFIDDPDVLSGRFGYQAFRVADYDTVSPGNRPGLDYTGMIDELPYADPFHRLNGYAGNYYLLPPGGSGSFRAATTGLGDLRAFLYDEEAATLEQLPAGPGGNVSLALPSDGTVLLLDAAFSPLQLEVSAGSVVSASDELAVYPDPCLGTLYLQFVSNGRPVELVVFDSTGSPVETVNYGPVASGEAMISYRGASELATGIYMYRFSQSGRVETGKFAVVR